MNTTSHNTITGVAVATILLVGLAFLGIGNATDIYWMRAVGFSLLILLCVLGTLTLVVPIVVFFAWLDWIGFMPISRIIGWVRRQIALADERAAARAGVPVLIEDQFRLFATRQAPVATPRDLRRAVARLVRKLSLIGEAPFTLYGYSPTMQKLRVMPFGFSRVGYFLDRSAIEWNFGRELSDPTHEIVFFSRFNGTCAVYLRISFVVEGTEATCPGLCAELRLTPAAAGHDDAERAQRVERLFRLLVETLATDSGHVELPGQHEQSAGAISGEVECV
jgi:hypothetical protein